jgi:hypothetical protein
VTIIDRAQQLAPMLDAEISDLLAVSLRELASTSTWATA